MKTLVLSADDIQQFNKLIYDQQKTAAALAQMEQSHGLNSSTTSNINSSNGNILNTSAYSSNTSLQQQSQAHLPTAHIMSLQYYLKHPSVTAAATLATPTSAGNNNNSNTGISVNYPTTVIQSHQHQLNQLQQSQRQILQQQQQTALRLKQSSNSNNSVHHHQLPNGYHTHQHHPYYGTTHHTTTTTTNHMHGLPQIVAHAHTHSVTNPPTATTTTTISQNAHHHHQRTQNAAAAASVVPVHALNQNSNFSAVSSSTGGGTNSSHAPTQQSNTTGSSLSPPAAVSANPRTQPANKHNNTTTIATTTTNSIITPPPRYTIVNANSANGSGSNSSSGGAKKMKTEPVLTQFCQSERLTFASSHLTWSQEHWRRLILQDERKFNLDGPDGYSNYYHDLRNHERSLSQRPRGISVYVYLLITAAGPIHLEVSTSKVGAESIIDTLMRQRTNIITKLGGNGEFLLQDHNWTTNALPTAQDMLNSEGIKTQKWPTIAHDMNIMENIWGWMIREVYDGGRKFSRKDDLIFRIREAWARLPMDLIRNLYSTLPERVSELYLTRGAYTNC